MSFKVAFRSAKVRSFEERKDNIRPLPLQEPNVRSPIRAVVFDLDGLMVNTEEVFHLTGHELMRRRGKVATQALFNQMMGRRAREAFAAMIEMMELTETIDELQAESESVFDDLLEKHLCTMPGLIELLGHIEPRGSPRGGHILGSRIPAPNAGSVRLGPPVPDEAHGGRRNARQAEPEIYLKAAQRIGVDPHEMLVLEDSEAGNAGRSCRRGTYHFGPAPAQPSHDFSPAKHVASSLVDPVILELIGVR